MCMKRHSQGKSINLRHQMLSPRAPVIIRPLRMEVPMDVEGQMSPGELGNQGILGHEGGRPRICSRNPPGRWRAAGHRRAERPGPGYRRCRLVGVRRPLSSVGSRVQGTVCSILSRSFMVLLPSLACGCVISISASVVTWHYSGVSLCLFFFSYQDTSHIG